LQAPAINRGGERERRRRERHWRRRRRDLLEDVVMGLVLMLVALVLTAGLGVIALLEVPVGAAVVGSFVVERTRRRRYNGRGARRSRAKT
jgi:hypothetical protein